MKPNLGQMPDEAAGKRIRGIFRNGNRFPADGSTWAADGRSGVRWTLTGCPWDIIKYEVAG